jgi:VanZ family protein
MFWRYLLPGIFWLALILLLSLAPGDEIPSHVFSLIAFDKLMHWFFYGMLTHLWLVGFKKQYRFKYLKKHSLAIVLPAVLLVGITIELIQGGYIEGRYFEGWDILANGIGAGMGVGLFVLIYGKETLI